MVRVFSQNSEQPFSRTRIARDARIGEAEADLLTTQWSRDVRARDQSEYVTPSETETRGMEGEWGRGGAESVSKSWLSLAAELRPSFRSASLCGARAVTSPRARAPLRPRHAWRAGQVNAEPFAGWKEG